jgi:hypothetical protein
MTEEQTWGTPEIYEKFNQTTNELCANYAFGIGKKPTQSTENEEIVPTPTVNTEQAWRE